MPDNQPAGIELTLKNGNVIKAGSAEEALKIAAKMVEDNSDYAREMKAKFETLEGQYNTVQQQIEALKPKEVPTSGFSKDTYYQLLHDDPIKAQNYVDAARFGVSNPDEVPTFFTGMYDKVSKLDGNTLAATFVNSHQDFPQDEESAKIMTQRIKQLQAEGYPVAPGTMDLAYYQLRAEGKIKPIETPAEEESFPPSPSGFGAGPNMDEIKKWENLPDAELHALIKSKGML